MWKVCLLIGLQVPVDSSTPKYRQAALRNTVSWEEEGERDREDEEMI